MNKHFDKNYTCLKPFLSGLLIFLGILFLGLVSCSIVTDYSPDTTPPTVTISTNQNLEKDIPGTITFIFSEKVTNFTPDDIQIFMSGVNLEKGRFVTNSQKSYSLEITPKAIGILYVKIQANSFEDLSANKNDKPYSTNFKVSYSSTATHTISFKLNGGLFKNPKITNLRVDTNTVVKETRLGGILSYPPTGPKPSIQAVTRGIFEWRNNGIKYDFSAPISSDLTLEAVWSNSCGKVETFHPANNDELTNYINAAVVADSTTNLNHIDTSAITDMNNLFSRKYRFKGEIGCWNTANVTNMREMFNNAWAFNQDISSWNVANVTDMSYMFKKAFVFNQDIGSWNVANVKNMGEMFNFASVFNQDISSWSVNNVTNYYNMFSIGSAMATNTNWHPKFDETPPTVNIYSQTLIKEKPAYLSFVFSEKVNKFTPDDIQIFMSGVNLEKGSFVTNSQKTYSLEITPKAIGILYVSIQTNSFEDLFANQNDKPYSNSFTVSDSTTTTHTISFNLNGGSFIFPQITNLKVVDNTAIEENRLGGILSYPPTGPKPSIQAVTRDIFEWRNNGTKYDFSTPVSSDLTLEAVWSNSCGKVETFHPTNKTQLTNYVDAAVVADSTTNLNHIDTSAITDMSNLFIGKKSFNGKIGCWNTANVNNMYAMFWDADVFNQDIGSWDVADVKNMEGMFQNAKAFDGDISSWNVANVKNMREMFFGAAVFNGDIGSWDVANVTTMEKMFSGAGAFNGYIGSWNVANVTTMEKMFSGAGAFNGDINTWDVASVTNMREMFNLAYAFNQDISSWNVANVTTMAKMFETIRNFNQDLSSWNVANVTDMSYMFKRAYSFNQDLSSWNVANVTDMSYMFKDAYDFNQDLSSWSVNNVTNYYNMFAGSAMASETAKHPIFDETPPTVIINSDTLTEGIPAYLSFTFSEKVTNFTPNDIQFLTNEANGVGAAKGSFVTNSQKTYSLEITPTKNGTLYVSIQANSFEDLYDNQNDKPYSNSFTVLDSTTTTHTISFNLNGGSFISPQITNLKVVDNTAIEETKLGGILSYPPTGTQSNIQAVTRNIFEWRNNGTKYDFSALVSSDLTLEAVWSNSCGKAETFHPANRTQLTNYVNAAVGANSTTNLNHIDTSAITDMNNLFNKKRSFNGKIDCWNTANVTNMASMFTDAQTFNQDISSWDVSMLADMSYMFSYAFKFNQDISSWDVSMVADMSYMFRGATKFNQDISSWDVANVTTMAKMFDQAAVFNQNIGSWDVSSVTDMTYMFNRAGVFNQNLSSWSVNNVTKYDNMFTGSSMASETAKHPVFNKP